MRSPLCSPASCLLLLAGGTAMAQAPLVGDDSETLRAQWLASAVARVTPQRPLDSSGLSAGLLSISRDAASPWMPLIHGLGQGSTTLGQGVIFSGSKVLDGWEVSATGTALRDFDSRMTQARLLEFALVKHTEGGWRWGLEKKPFQWGYGLFGGYLIGDSSDPVPRLMLESPSTNLSLFGVPLGAWGFDTFLGQLEWDRRIPTWISNPQAMQEAFASQGDLRRPNLSGLRLKAAFGPHVDMNFAVVSKWGGVDASGRNIMQGLSVWNYPLAYLGAENIAVAEATGNSQDPNAGNRFTPNSSYHNLSNALADVEVRVRFPETAARWFGAKGLAVYLSRGAANVNWQWKDFLKRPFSAWSHDLRFVGKKLSNRDLAGSHPDSLWGWAYAQSAPGLVHINDKLGAQWVFDRWDLGIELADLHNQVYPASTFRAYGNGRVLSGHSRFGDSLGEPLGGEVYQQGFNLGMKLPHEGQLRFSGLDAIRFYRDSPLTSTTFVPGVDDHFFHVQLEGQWPLAAARIGGSLAWERHRADQFIPGNHKSNWILSLGYAIPLFQNPPAGSQ